MEFKLDESAGNVIQQIKDREYAYSYLNCDKTLVLVGISFSKKGRNVESWESEILKK